MWKTCSFNKLNFLETTYKYRSISRKGELILPDFFHSNELTTQIALQRNIRGLAFFSNVATHDEENLRLKKGGLYSP